MPLVASLTVPLSDRSSPSLGGVPFFCWHRMVAIAVGVLCAVVVSRARGRAAARRDGDRHRDGAR